MKFDGDWSCVITTPVGVQHVTFHIEDVDGTIRGEARGAETVPFIAPSLSDGRLTWTQKVTRPMRLTIAFDVGSDGDQLFGTAKAGIFPRVKVEGRRVDSAIAWQPPLKDQAAAPLPSQEARVRSTWPKLSVDTAGLGGPVPKVGMLAFPGMTMLDLIGPQTVLSGPTTSILISKTRQIVVSDTGVAIMPDVSFEQAPADLDVLFVPGGPGQVAVMSDDETLAFLADRGGRARYVTSACTGSLILGAAGLLRGYRATSHWAALELLGVFGAEVENERVVVDRNRITGGGVTAGIDFALVLLAQLFDERVARTTQLLMEYDPDPPFKAGHPRDAGEETIAEALAIMAPVANETLAVIEARFGREAALR